MCSLCNQGYLKLSVVYIKNGKVVISSRIPKVAPEDRKWSYLARSLIGWRDWKKPVRSHEGIMGISSVS